MGGIKHKGKAPKQRGGAVVATHKTPVVRGAKAGQEKPRTPVISKDTVASISTVKILYGLAEGEIQGLVDGGKSIRLDGTPLISADGKANFEGVEWDFRAGTNDQEYIKGFPDVSNETPINVELRSDTPWVQAFTDPQLSAVRVRLKWNRLSSTNAENGDVSGHRIDYAIDLQTNGGAYTEVIKSKVAEKTSAGYERTHRIDLPRSPTGWQIRVRRLTPNSTSDLIQDTMSIDAVAEVIDVKLSYPNTALLGLRYDARTFSNVAKIEVHARGKIIRVPSNYDPVARTYTGLWDGTFKDAYSNNPAWVYYDICTQWRYGLGERIAANMVDKWTLYQLGQFCDQEVSDGQGGLEPRFAVNVYLQTRNDAYQVLNNLAGIFRAMSFWNGERIVLDADVPQDPVYTFTRANVVEGEFEYTGTRLRDRHTLVKVAWDNPANGFKTEYDFVRDEKAMAKVGAQILDLAAFGCTSRGQAQRAGIWALRTEQLETRQVAFQAGLDGFIPQVGNIINVSDELFAGRANGGRISSVSADRATITLDRQVTVAAGDVLMVNNTDGRAEKRIVKTVSGRAITVVAPFEKPAAENVWAVETADLKLMRFRVMQSTRTDENTFNIVAIQHEPQKFPAIDFGADVKPTNITIVNPDEVSAPAAVTISSRHHIEQAQTITTLMISWDQVKGAVAYDVEWRKDEGAWIKLPRTGGVSTEISGVYSGNYQARVRSVSAFDVQSNATTSILTEVKGKIGLPPTVVGLTATGILFGMDLKWGFAAGSGDAAFTEIQVGSAPNVNVAALTQVSYSTNTHTVTGLQGNLKQSYRARLVDKLGFKSPWSAWVTGTTDASADKVMDLIQGQINEGSLNDILTSKIADIKINKDAISKETEDRVQAIIDANSRIDGVISNADVEYYLSTNTTTPTGGEWLTKAPDWQQGKYMFSRTKLTGADGTVKYNPSANGVNITGAKGDKGDKGERGADGIRGLNGIDGKDGTNGLNGLNGNFTHIAYSTSSTGIPFSPTWFADATYIGIYVDRLEASSATASKYNWSLIKGANGANGAAGKAGADGRTPYFHVAYATSADGSQGFSTTVSTGKTYIGQYTDYKLEDEENDKSLYSWTKIKGEVGDKGDIGRGIESFVEQYGVSRSETDVPTTWTAAAPAVTKGDYVWTRSKITYKDPVKVEYTDPIVSPAWAAISQFNTEFINFQEDTGNEFIAQGEKLEGIISDYKPRYTDKTRYTDASRSQQWTYWKTVAADNYASNQRITNLQSEFADSNANFTNELFTLATKDKSIAADITQLYAETGANYGLIQDVSIAISTPSTGLAAKVTELQGRADAAEVLLTDKGEIIFSYGAPPAKKEHKNNVWFKLKNEDNGTVSQTPHQWDGSTWVELKDSAALAAKADAEAAKTAADNKGEVIYSGTTPSADKRKAQNLWIDTSLVDGKPVNTPKRWNGSAWVAVTDKAVVDAQAAANAAAEAAGNKGEVIYSATTPSADKQKAQNLWIDTSGGKNTPKRWAAGAWLTVTDKAATDAQAAADAANQKLEPEKLASLVEGSGAFSDEFGSISGQFANFEAVVEGQKTAMEVISGIGNAEKLKNEIAKARLDKNVTNLNAQSEALTTQINGYTTKIADVTAKRNATTDTALKAEYNKLITDLTAAKADLTAQKSVIADQVAQLAAEKKVLDDFKEVEDGVRAQHAIKIDNDGKIVGYGLVLQKDGFSAFDVRADRFSISAPTGKPNDVNGTSPFMVLTNPQVIDGVRVPAGTYMRNTYIAKASIDLAQINTASITSLDALAANIGHFKSAESGARLEIKDSLLSVYDANNKLRVRLGLW